MSRELLWWPQAAIGVSELAWFGWHATPKRVTIPSHALHRHQVILVAAGAVEARVDGRPLRIVGHRFVILPATCQLGGDGSGAIGRFAWIGLDPDAQDGVRIADAASRDRLRAIATSVSGRILPASSRMLTRATALADALRRDASQLERTGLVALLFDAVLSEAEHPPAVPASDQAVDRLAAGIAADPAAGFDPGAAAKAIGLSRAALFARFRACTGYPPHRYLLLVRTRRAEEALLGGANPGDAAKVAGFPSTAAMARAFHAFHGCAPSQWRERP
jgi:AraC-like DNA-binding protein